VKPFRRDFRVAANTRDVAKRNGEFALESPELIETFDVQAQSVAGDFWSYQWLTLVRFTLVAVSRRRANDGAW
jgi:hypothetical protein